MRHAALFAIALLMAAPAARAGATTTQSTSPKPNASAPGQGSQASPSSPTSPASQPTPAPAPQTEVYTYSPDGRRDPFLSLIGTGGGDTRGTTSRRGDGAASMLVAEISVRGVMESRNGLIAMIQGPDSKTYIVHAGDKLLDGTIKSITPQGLIIIQEVNDPLSLVKQREVPKLLRSLEGGRQ